MFYRQRRVIQFGRPPFPFRRRHAHLGLLATLVLVVCTLGAVPVPAAPAAPADYRLAGTMAVGKDYVAFLELPSGGQVLVRKGSVVGNAKVADVTEKSVRLVLPDRALVLSLEGSGAAAPDVRSAAVQEAVDDDRNRIYTRTVSPEQVSRELSKSASKSGTTPSNADARMIAAQRIAPVLDLPPGSRLLMVRGEPVTNADAAIKQIEKQLAANDGVVYLDIQVSGKHGRVYLMPAQD